MGWGNKDATPRTVAKYLVEAYKVTEEEAQKLVLGERHEKVMNSAIAVRSMAYYPGDKVAEVEGLEARPEYEEKDDE